jgi:hypothetical protein
MIGLTEQAARAALNQSVLRDLWISNCTTTGRSLPGTRVISYECFASSSSTMSLIGHTKNSKSLYPSLTNLLGSCFSLPSHVPLHTAKGFTLSFAKQVLSGDMDAYRLATPKR